MSLENKLGCSLYVRAEAGQEGEKGRQDKGSKKAGTSVAGLRSSSYRGHPKGRGSVRAISRLNAQPNLKEWMNHNDHSR